MERDVLIQACLQDRAYLAHAELLMVLEPYVGIVEAAPIKEALAIDTIERWSNGLPGDFNNLKSAIMEITRRNGPAQ